MNEKRFTLFELLLVFMGWVLYAVFHFGSKFW